MLDALNITEEDAQGLAELAQHDLALARDFARRAQAAVDADEASRLARSYQRAARSYRQTLALKARLKRDLAAAAQVQAATPRPRPGGAAVARRIGELRTALLRLAWDEAERAETEAAEIEQGEFEPGETDGEGDILAPATELFAFRRPDIEAAVSTAAFKPDFAEAPLDDDVARLALDQGFAPKAIARWRDMADPPQAALDAEAEEFDWRSSA